MSRVRAIALLAVVWSALVVGCTGNTSSVTFPAPSDSGGPGTDASELEDAGGLGDTGAVPPADAGSDATTPFDANVPDATTPADVNVPDATTPVDANVPDTNVPDTNVPDATPLDGGGSDAADASPAADASDAAPSPAVLTISDAPTLDYGTVLAGITASHTFTLTNSGATGASGLSAAALSAPFAFKGGSYPGTGGTCGAVLAASGATCTIVVTFAPTSAGLATGALTVGYFDGTATRFASRPIQGTGEAPAAIAISDGATFDYGAVVDGASADHTFTLTNGGGVAATSLAATALSAPFSFKGGAYPGTGGTCGASLASSAMCTVVVTFAPTSASLATGTLAVTYSTGVASGAASRPIQGTGELPAVVTVSDGPTFNYGSVVVGISDDHSFTLSNSGSATATALSAAALSAPFSFKGGTYPGTGGTCATALAPSASCTVVVTFAPTTLGAASATLSVGYTDGAASQSATRAIQGTGIAAGALTISDGATFDYGGVVLTTSLDHTFTLTNTGAAPATAIAPAALSAPFSFKGGAYPGTGGTCAATLAGGNATCTIVVTFAPTAASLATGTLSIGYNNGAGSQTATRAIQGTGLAAALLTISDGPTFGYGSVVDGTTSAHVFTVTNGGGATAMTLAASALSAPFAFKGGTYPGSGGTCGTSLLGAATCTIAVTFAPTTPGAASGSLALGYFDGASPQSATRPLAGTGVAPALLSISDGPTFVYGSVVQGTSADHAFTITNGGGATATSLAATPLSAPFSFKGGSYPGTGGTCGASLAPGACTIVVTFAPTSPGAVTGTLTLGYFDGANTQSVARPFQGNGLAPAVLSISDGPTFDYTTRVDGTSTDHTFTVTNGGSATATTIAPSTLALPFTFKGGSYPGTGGTCAASLAGSGATCTLVVTFSPVSPGLATAVLGVTYFDGANPQSAPRAIQGTGAAPALLAISDGPTFGFGNVADGASSSHTFTVTNSGGSTATAIAATALSAPYSFKGGTFPGTGGTCGASLAGAGATCSVVVTFAPTSPGLASSAVTLGYFDGANTQSAARPMQGTGLAPAVLAISDGPTFVYGSDVDGTKNDHAFTVTNSGSATATAIAATALAAPYSFKGGTYPGTGGTCGASLAGSSATCTVVVTFAPTTAGLSSSALTLGYFDGANTQSVSRPVQGTGVAAAVLAFYEGSSYAFGTLGVGQTGEHVFRVTNTGAVAATAVTPGALSAPFAFKGAAYPGFGGTCGASVPAGTTCTIVADYTAVSGTSSGSLSLGYNDGAQAQNASIGLSGTGTSAAVLALTDYPPIAYTSYGVPADPSTHDFGAHGTGSSTDFTFYVTNNGAASATAIAPVALAAPFSFKGGTFPGVGGGCGATLAPNATCTVVVTFAPTSSASPDLETLSLGYNDGTTAQTASRSMSGEVTTNAAVVIEDYQGISLGPYYDFGQVGVGTTVSHTFYVVNQGGATATALAAGAASPPFAFAGGAYPGTGGSCGASLAVGAACSIVGSFAPATSGAASGALAVAYNNGASVTSTTRALRGTGTTAAFLAVTDNQSPSLAYSYGTLPVSSSADATFTVTNEGAATATSLTGAALAAPFSYKGGTYPGAGGTCGASLAAGASCNVVVTFAPTLNATKSAALSLGYNDGTAAQTAQRAITGTGTTQALLQIADSTSTGNNGGFGGQYQPYDFGTSGVPTDHTFYVTNAGAQSATSIAGAAQTGPTFQMKGGSYPGTGGTCGASLAAGATCTVVVTFSPGAASESVGSFSIGYNDGSAAQTATRALTGEASLNALLVIVDYPGETQPGTSPFDYGTTGTPEYHLFYVFNGGESAATSIADGATLGSGFAFTGGAYPGTGGSCGATLASGASCAISVTFTPSGSTVASSVITLDYFNGATNQTATRAVTGTGTTAAVLEVYFPGGGGGGGYGFGTWGIATTQTFNVFNSGAQSATSMGDGHNLAAPFAFAGGAYPGTGGTCGATLASNATCTIVVSFTPSGSGTSSSTIGVAYYDGKASQDATLSVNGTSTTLALVSIASYPGANGSSPPYSYGTTGQPEDQTFYVTNAGAQKAAALADGGTLGSGFNYKGGSYPGTGGTCGGSLASGATCQIVVTFTPTGSGPLSSTITLNYNNGASVQQATLGVSGTATTAAVLTIGDFNGGGTGGPSFYFGTWGVPVSHTFYVTNSGATGATQMGDAGSLSGGFAFTGGTYPGTGGTCGTSLATGATCTVVVTFTPSGSGAASGTLGVKYNDGSTQQTAQRPLSATGTASALVQIFDYMGQQTPFSNPYNYGTDGVPTQATFYVWNTGAKTATALADGGTLGGDFGYQGGTYPGTGGTCGATLASNASCTIVVTFSPSGNGASSSTVTLGYNDGTSAQTATRALTGTSTSAALLVFQGQPVGTPNPLNFGTSGVPVTQTLTVQNVGAQSAKSMADGGTLSGMFAYAGGTYPGTGGTCGATLASNATCTVVITFTPTGSGVASGTVTIAYNDGTTAQTVSRPLTGTATANALLIVGTYPGQTQAFSQPYDFGTWGVQTTGTLYLINIGAKPATTVVDGGALGGDFGYAGTNGFPGGGTCTGTLAAGASCTLVVAFKPTGNGLVTSPLRIDYNDGASAQSATLGVQGTATTAAFLVVDDFSGPANGSGEPGYSWGTWGTPSTHTFFVVNNGAQQAMAMADGATLGSGFAFAGGYPGTGGTCGTTLASNASCTLVVTFTPSGSGARSSTLTLDYNDGTKAQTALNALSGTATNRAYLIVSEYNGGPGGCLDSCGPYPFGTEAVNGTLTTTFTVYNVGAAATTALGDGGGLAAPFAYAGPGAFPGGGTCGAVLAAGATCTVVVAFKPTTTGTFSGDLTLAYGDGLGAPLGAGRRLSGTGQ